MIQIANPDIRPEDRRRVDEVLEAGQLADGPTVRAFEEDCRELFGSKHAVATSNGTTALHAALKGLGIGPGDRVVTTPFSFIASANAARLVGADVEFVDIEPDTFTLDPAALEARLDSGEPIDAVIVVHLFGLPADLDPFLELREAYGFALIEDAAQAHGATYQGEPVGSIGDVGCFSFYPTKNVTSGEGGMITTDRANVAEAARRFVDHGRVGQYEHAAIGHNFRLSSVHAAIGRSQLERLEEYTETRRLNAAHLTDRLADFPLETPVEPPDRTHVYHQYTIRHPDRDRLQSKLEARGVGTGIYYPVPIHQQPAYADVSADAPIAERAASEVLSLPVHPGVSTENIDEIQQAIAAALEVTA